MTAPDRSSEDAATRRKAVVRTALLIGGLAVAIYVAFILSGVLST
jgi:hypothetical protein